jgi:hypothetical protein
MIFFIIIIIGKIDVEIYKTLSKYAKKNTLKLENLLSNTN